MGEGIKTMTGHITQIQVEKGLKQLIQRKRWSRGSLEAARDFLR